MRGIGLEEGQQIEELPDLDELALVDLAHRNDRQFESETALADLDSASCGRRPCKRRFGLKSGAGNAATMPGSREDTKCAVVEISGSPFQL